MRPRLLAAAALAAALAACAPVRPLQAPTASAPLHVRVLTIHDFHGALRPITYSWSEGRPIGGAGAVKATMDRLEEACACPAVRLDGGDQMQGTLESNLSGGAATVAALNHIPLDAAAVGNHELDWGVDTLVARQGEARYAWLAANVFRVDNGRRPEWAEPFAIIERRGVKFGVVGYATVTTPSTLRPEVTEPYEFRSGYAAIRDALDAVWRARPDFVILVAHAGGECGAQGCVGEMADLASELPRGSVHLIVGGHDHRPGEGVVNAIPIVRAGSSGRAVGIVDLFRRADGVYGFRTSQQTVYADAVPEDRELAALLAPYVKAADLKGKEQVTVLAEPLSANREGDRRLGALVAEAIRRFTGAEIGMQNSGGVRADLPQGAVTFGDVHRVLPFDNMVVTLTITGAQLRTLVQETRDFYYSNLPDVIRDDQSYRLATNDFLADGGDGLSMLPSLPRELTDVTVLDAVIQYLQTLPTPVTYRPSRE